jgi:hypothetical protein
MLTLTPGADKVRRTPASPDFHFLVEQAWEVAHRFPPVLQQAVFRLQLRRLLEQRRETSEAGTDG